MAVCKEDGWWGMSKEALRLALEALENAIHPWEKEGAITALREALAKQPAQQDSTCSNALRIQHKPYPRTCKKCGLGPCVELAQQALDKKAENARELGLDYEPAQPRAWFTIDELNAWADKKLKENPQWAEQPAQQEPVAWADECRIELVIAIHFLASDFENALGAFGGDIEARRKAEGDIAHARSVASRWNWNGTSPPAQRTWVGLTFAEICECENDYLHIFARAIEAKLKEKNT